MRVRGAQIGRDLRPLIRFVRRTKNVSRRRHKPNLSRTEKVLFIFISIPTVLDFPPLSRPVNDKILKFVDSRLLYSSFTR